MNKAIIILFFTFLILPIFAQAEILQDDKDSIEGKIEVIEESLNNGDIDVILDLISENARVELKAEIENETEWKYYTFEETIVSFEEYETDKIKVNGIFSVDAGTFGLTWNIYGVSNYFIFEKINDEWYLYDTNFHEKISYETARDVVGGIFDDFFGILLIIIAVLIIVVVVVLIIVYIFVIRRKKDETNNEKL